METAFAEYLAHAPVFVRNLDGEILYWTSGARELYGYGWAEAVGRSSHELLKTVFPIPLEEINRDLTAKRTWRGLLQHTRSDGTRIWTESEWRLRNGEEHGTYLVVESNTDVTHRENLTRELDHRLKNTLSIIQGLVKLTLKGGGRNRIELFEQRLSAMANAHAILLQHHWHAASLREVLDRALSPFAVGRRVKITGEHLMLQPGAVIAYSLAFHELATNAVKHGALSTPTGRLEVNWRSEGTDVSKLHLIWREFGAPKPNGGGDVGGGTRLLTQVVSAELGTPVHLRFEPTGLVCEFDGPVQKAPALPS